MVKDSLGDRSNWRTSDDLSMLFEGTYDTAFYRMVRDSLHDEVRLDRVDDCRWARLGHEAHAHRTSNPVLLATGS
jgi:anaerobic magnesium-protoporphyrin IX monomethyl ester cyclase